MSAPDGMLFGIPYYVNPHVPKSVRRQVRFPRSKKKRIRKKWAKDSRNYREFGVVWMIGGAYHGSRDITAVLLDEIPRGKP